MAGIGGLFIILHIYVSSILHLSVYICLCPTKTNVFLQEHLPTTSDKLRDLAARHTVDYGRFTKSQLTAINF